MPWTIPSGKRHSLGWSDDGYRSLHLRMVWT